MTWVPLRYRIDFHIMMRSKVILLLLLSKMGCFKKKMSTLLYYYFFIIIFEFGSETGVTCLGQHVYYSGHRYTSMQLYVHHKL